MVVTIEMTYFQVCSKETDYMPSFHGGYYRDDIYFQVCSKETDYMPSFHGGYYRDDIFSGLFQGDRLYAKFPWWLL